MSPPTVTRAVASADYTIPRPRFIAPTQAPSLSTSSGPSTTSLATSQRPTTITFRLTLDTSALKPTTAASPISNPVFYLYYDLQLLTAVSTYAKFIKNIQMHRAWGKLKAEMGRDCAVVVGACSVVVGREELWFEREGEFRDVMADVGGSVKLEGECVRCTVWVEDGWA